MAKIKITKEERDSYISNKSFLEHVYKSNSKAQSLKDLYKIILQQDFTCLQNNDLKNEKLLRLRKLLIYLLFLKIGLWTKYPIFLQNSKFYKKLVFLANFLKSLSVYS